MASSQRPRRSPDAQPPGRKVTWTTTGAGPIRQQIETRSRSLLVRLHDLPRWVLFVAFSGLAVGGAFLPASPGVACLLVLAVFLGWLLYLSWPSLDAPKRLLRLVVVAALLMAAVVRAVNG